MKKSLLILLFAAGAFSIQSCDSGSNRSADDSVEHAMDQNENRTGQGSGTGTGIGTNDASDFAVKAADAGLAEVNAGKVAQQKAQDQRVKDFAAMMVEDHSKTNEELKSIAANKNITLPTAPGEDRLENIASLNEYSGADFDKEYIDMMVSEHQKTIDLFEDAAEDNDDPELKAFASKALPGLKAHLEQAEAIQESLR